MARSENPYSINYPKYGGKTKRASDRERGAKMRSDKFLEEKEVLHLLDTIKKSDRKTADRDYALVFLALRIGLRVSEIVRFTVEGTLSRVADTGCLILGVSKRKKDAYHKAKKEKGARRNRRIHCTVKECKKYADTRGMCQRHYNDWLRRRDYEGEPEEYPVSADVKEFLLDYAETVPVTSPKSYLFPSHVARRGHITTRTAERVFDLYMRMAGLSHRRSFHSLRHTFGVMVQRKYGDINLTKKLIRHQDIGSTQIYVELTDEQVRDVLEDFSGIK